LHGQLGDLAGNEILTMVKDDLLIPDKHNFENDMIMRSRSLLF
jgi:hypothetical protein